jgi:LPS O-antigen subunit length determinant protein (WzzB/FepE family)
MAAFAALTGSAFAADEYTAKDVLLSPDFNKLANFVGTLKNVSVRK